MNLTSILYAIGFTLGFCLCLFAGWDADGNAFRQAFLVFAGFCFGGMAVKRTPTQSYFATIDKFKKMNATMDEGAAEIQKNAKLMNDVKRLAAEKAKEFNSIAAGKKF